MRGRGPSGPAWAHCANLSSKVPQKHYPVMWDYVNAILFAGARRQRFYL